MVSIYTIVKLSISMATKEEMEQLTVNIPEKLMKEFREKARQKYGDKRGYIKDAVIDALKMWTEQNK